MFAPSPGAPGKYGDPETASAPLMGGSSVRYRPGFFIKPPPGVIAKRSLWNQMWSYAIAPAKYCEGVTALPPVHFTPPPYSQPKSAVKDIAIWEIPVFSGWW